MKYTGVFVARVADVFQEGRIFIHARFAGIVLESYVTLV